MRLPIPLIVLGILLLGVTAEAYPNLSATSGILAVPTAVVVPANDAQWAGDVLFQNDTAFNGRITYGIADRLEVGAGIVAGPDTILGLNAKLRLPGMIGGFNWAAGATYSVADKAGSGTQLYATGTRAIPWVGATGLNLLGTLGVSFTDIKTASAFRPFVGAQLELPGGTEIAGEFVFETGNFTDSVSTLLVRHSFTSRVAGEVGFTNAFGFTSTQDHNLFVGIAFTERGVR